jgi:hypothetical protein
MLKTNNEYKMGRKDYKRITMENYTTEVNRKSDKKEKMELDWTHITPRSRSSRENRIRLESSGI